jgi:putative SOS response-associated peptidase YedK
MCGRFKLAIELRELARLYELTQRYQTPPRYNIAPKQEVAAVRRDRDGKRECVAMQWGIAASNRGQLLINARAETIDTAPAFRAAYRNRRCAILADGWYEFEERDGKKLPWLYALGNGAPFLFAGLWEIGRDAQNRALPCCAIVTVPANALAAKIHDRMPAILDDDGLDRWLGGAAEAGVKSVLRPFPAERIAARRVSTLVNNWRNEGPELVAAEISLEPRQGSFQLKALDEAE